MDGKLYDVLSPTKIRLSAEAKWWAKEYGLSNTEMARYLLDRHQQGDATSASYGESHQEDILPNVTVEGRRDDYVPVPPVPPMPFE
jgi:hypothetical protein